MNIGVDIRCLMDKERTGVGEYTFGFLEALFKIDQNNQYYLFYNSNKNVSVNIPQWKQDNVHYIKTKYSNKILNLLLFLRVLKLDKLMMRTAKSLPPLVGEGRVGLDLWFSPNLNFTNLSRKVKHIQTIHDLSFEFLPECFTWKQRLWHWLLNPQYQCQKANLIITPSESTKRDVVNSYQITDNKIQVLKPGFGVGRGTGDEEQRVEKCILYLGTLEPRKNIEIIIEAYKLLGLNYKLVIAGGKGWKNKKLLKLIQETPGVKYLGYVNENKKKELYKNASLFVFPSLYEGFGLPVLEAVSYGVPVITSNRASLPEVVEQAGYLINPHNVSELAGAMKLILSDEKLRGILIEKGREQSLKFNWEKAAKEFLMYYAHRN